MTVDAARAEDLRMDIGALLAAVWRRALRIVIVTAILVGFAYVFLMFVPKLYESSAGLLVEDRSNSYTQAAGSQPASGSGITIDAMMSSQIELVKSRDTLLAVIDQLKLRDVPEFGGVSPSPITYLLTLIGRAPSAKSLDETALTNLNDRLTVIRERDSAVISIYVRSTDPELAATIANAIAQEHVKRRAGQSLADTAESTQYLARQIEELRSKVQEADSKVASFRIDNGIFSGSNNTSLTDQQLSDIAKQVTDAQERRNTAQQRANLIRELLKAGQPIDAVPDVRDSIVIQQLTQTRATLQGDLAQRSATLLPSHPTMKALAAQVKEIDDQIADEGRRIAAGLEAQVKIESGLLDSLNDDLTRAKLSSSTATRDGVTLDSLMREAKAQRDLLDSYLLRYRDAASRTDAGSALPDVRQITQAAPAVAPASPKVALTLGAVAFIALALQIGSTLFGELMSGRAVYDRNSPHARAMHDADAAEEEDASIDGRQYVPEPAPPLPETALRAEQPPIAEMPPPIPAPAEQAPPLEARHLAAANDDLDLSNLSADLAIGRVRIVLLAAVTRGRDAALVADRLVADALQRGLSVCRIDAGSAHISDLPGITDLCAERASFGDVVHKVSEGLAEVPWGTLPALERRSMKPVTLIEALSDIYEAVVVVTGKVGMGSSLPVFAGVNGRVVLVRDAATSETIVEGAVADAGMLGFEAAQAVGVPEPQAAVA
ncbi:MAG TPA: GumC family protein [Devosia sp.]|nr:GumC family protein [Devosia sp.]